MPHPSRTNTLLRTAAVLLPIGLLASGCAVRPPASNPEALAEYQANRDPLEPTNRFLYRVNDTIDNNALKPVAQGYRHVLPGGVRRSIGNALGNASSPAVFANDVLQGHPRKAAETVTRFVVNTSVGVGGLFDVATRLGLPPHRSGSFGTSLAVWGVGDGPFLFLPVLGPSNVRDTAGFAGNSALDPLSLARFGGSTALQVSRAVVGAVDTRERLIDPIEQLKRDSLDPYATFRSVYRQTRASEIEEARHDSKPLPPPKPLF